MDNEEWDSESSDNSSEDEEPNDGNNCDELGVCPFCNISLDPKCLLTEHFLVEHNFDFISLFTNRLNEDNCNGKK